MRTIRKPLLVSALAGLLLGAAAWLCWQLGSFVSGIVLLAALASCLMFSLRSNSADKLPTPLQKTRTPPKRRAKRKRRPHPLRSPLRARLSAELRWLTISPALQALLHINADALLNQSIFHTLHPEDVPTLDKALQTARTTRQTQHVTCRFLAAVPAASASSSQALAAQADTKLLPTLHPKAFVYVRLSVWAKTDRAGKALRYLCQVVDLTKELLEKELELRTARKVMARAKKYWRTLGKDLARLKLSYQELYHNAPVMYFSINAEGKLVTFNDTLLRTLGYERAQLQGGSYATLLAPTAEKNHVPILQRMPWQEGEFETQWRKQDGALIDVWIHTVPVSDEKGNFARYRSAALDLTEKNRLANELRFRGDELERANQRLRQTNTELEDFTHVVSHDLKEPLRTLQAYSHILAEEHAARLGPDGFQYINHLIRASRRLGALIDELLQLSQAGRITRAPQGFNLLEIVATVRQDLVDLIQRKQASLLTEGSLPNLSGDPVRITQLLTNLVANGLKYNQAPAPQVVLGALPCAEDPTRVTIFVRDNGIGIDPAFHQQIFGIFRRLHQVGEYEGTGAGLAICKKIVEGHGGKLWVESQLGQGATFFFTLPHAPPGKETTPRNGVLTSALERKGDSLLLIAPHRKPSNGAALGAQIVLVEDQPEVGMIIQKLGQRDGLAITWFPTAEAAWEHLQHARPDLLLLDVNLPGMSGVELCQRIRTLAHLKTTPVAMFTPEQEAEQLQTLRDAGADFFVTKDLLCQPILWQQKMQELLEQIRQPVAH